MGSHRVGHDWSDLAAVILFIYLFILLCWGLVVALGLLSSFGTWTPECGLSSCASWAYLLQGTCDLSPLIRDWACVPCPGGGFLIYTTREVPGKTRRLVYSFVGIRQVEIHPLSRTEDHLWTNSSPLSLKAKDIGFAGFLYWVYKCGWLSKICNPSKFKI